MENMSQAPFVLHGARDGFRFGTAAAAPGPAVREPQDPYCGLYMAQTAEKVAKRLGVSREEQDEYALRSHQLGAAAVGRVASPRRSPRW